MCISRASLWKLTEVAWLHLFEIFVEFCAVRLLQTRAQTEVRELYVTLEQSEIETVDVSEKNTHEECLWLHA